MSDGIPEKALKDLEVRRFLDDSKVRLVGEVLKDIHDLPSIDAWKNILVEESRRRGGTVSEAAERIGLSPKTLYNWLNRGKAWGSRG